LATCQRRPRCRTSRVMSPHHYLGFSWACCMFH